MTGELNPLDNTENTCSPESWLDLIDKSVLPPGRAWTSNIERIFLLRPKARFWIIPTRTESADVERGPRDVVTI